MNAVYYGNNRLLVETADGIACFLNTNDLVMTPTVALKGTWEPQVVQVLRQYLTKGAVFVDVGANIGYHSCVAANLIAPSGRLFMFEVDPASVEILRENLAINRVSKKLNRQAFLIEKAVSDRVGEATFYSRRRFASNSSLVPPGKLGQGLYRDDARKHRVPTTTLDQELIGTTDRIDLLKIDVEGGEWFVAQGMNECIRSFPMMNVLIEWSPEQIKRSGRSPAELASFFFALGFRALHLEAGCHFSERELLVSRYGNLLFERPA